MFRCLILASLAAALAACSPTFDWREVHAGSTGLKAMLPCKPATATRRVTMGDRQLDLHALGCDAGGSTFALLFAEIAPGSAADVLGQWKAATLSSLRSEGAREQPFRPPGALDLPQSVHVIAGGRRADGSPVQGQAAYFARGRHVFQAAVYAQQVRPEVTEPFFAALAFE